MPMEYADFETHPWGKRYFGDNSRCTLAYLFLPSGSSESPTPTSARSARVVRMDGWMDGWTVIKSVLRFSLFWCMLKIMYICTYICTQKLSPRFLWVSKFDIKFGSGVMNLENTIVRWLFRFLVPNLSLAAWKRRNRLPIADRRCAPDPCHPSFWTDADCRWVMPQLGFLSVRMSGNKRYH